MRSSHSAPHSASRPQGRTCSRCQSSWATPYPSPYMPCLRPGFSSQRCPKAHPSVPSRRHPQPGSTRLFRRLSPLPFVSQKISRIVSRKTATRFVSQGIAVTHFRKTTCATHNRVILGKCVHQKSRQFFQPPCFMVCLGTGSLAVRVCPPPQTECGTTEHPARHSRNQRGKQSAISSQPETTPRRGDLCTPKG